MRTMNTRFRIADGQRGFTLVEIMIALLIGLFLLGALFTIVQTNRQVFAAQSQLAQLHDSERMAMTLIADVVQAAGYFPDPTSNAQADVFTASGAFASLQAITGTYSATAPGDTISVRYMTANNDGVLNCSGVPNTTGGNLMYVNKFEVSNGQLVCTTNATQYNLVSGATNGTGVTNMTVLYGVKTNAGAAGNTVDTYMNASQMNTANWNSVISVLVRVTFTNPLYDALHSAGQAQPQTLSIQRVIGVMNQVGPTL